MVKAKAEITISRIIDIDKVTRYYLLQSSTATAPSKPTSNPPGGNWKTTEPSYTPSSTNTLYFVDLTVMTNGSFSYSAVSKSSSYEAAKEAWNKANNAQNTANSANGKIDDLQIGGRNLLFGTSNGSCLQWFNENSLKIENNNEFTVPVNTLPGTNDVQAVANEKFAFRTELKSVTEHIEKNNGILLDFLDSTHNRVTILWLSDMTFKTEWSIYSTTFIVPDRPDIAYVRIGLRSSAGIENSYRKLKLEKGNKPTDYTPAPEDTEEKISAVETVASATAGKFNWLVKSGTSSTDFTLTERVASLVSNEINLKGLVKFSGLNNETQKKITDANTWVSNNGQKAQNLYSMVSKWAAEAISDTTEINGGLIKAHTILAKHIDTEDLFAQNIIASGSIQSDNYAETDGIATVGSKWVLGDGTFKSKYLNWDKDGFMTATGGKIGCWELSEYGLGYNLHNTIHADGFTAKDAYEKYGDTEFKGFFMSAGSSATYKYWVTGTELETGEILKTYMSRSVNVEWGLHQVSQSRYCPEDDSFAANNKSYILNNGDMLQFGLMSLDNTINSDVYMYIDQGNKLNIHADVIEFPHEGVILDVNGKIKSSNINDSGWVNCTYGNGISNFAGNSANQVRVRKVNGVVFISGCVTNSTTWQNHDNFLTFPKEYAPERECRFVMQGSGSNRYLLYIGTNGVCRAERYSNNTTMNNTVPLKSWLNVFASWPAK